MFAEDFSIDDFETVGPIIEQLLESKKLTTDEAWAVDLACRAAADLASIRHSEAARSFYSRPDVQQRAAATSEAWLAQNAAAEPGAVALISGRLHVASVGSDGKLQLTPVFEL